MATLKCLKTLNLTLLIVCFICVLTSSSVRAEWNWDDPEYLQNTFTSFIEARFSDENLPGNSELTIPPSHCVPLHFGFQGTWETDTGRRYQVAFQDISVECWERIKQVMPRTPFKIKEVETVSGIDFLPFADSGPSILFKFDNVTSPTTK
jgi:hypothetical protein